MVVHDYKTSNSGRGLKVPAQDWGMQIRGRAFLPEWVLGSISITENTNKIQFKSSII